MIKERLQKLNEDILRHCETVDVRQPQVVLVSKFMPKENIQDAYEVGHRVFGESRVQELLEKQESLSNDIDWHFVGHLQTNKVKQIVGKVLLIHSVDSLKLAKVISKEAEKQNIQQECLVEINISEEETKGGFSLEELKEVFSELIALPHIKFRGVMAIASNTEDLEEVREDFKALKSIFEELKQKAGESFLELSMGMSRDWPVALEEGATILRIGTSVFGPRGQKNGEIK